MTEDEKRKAGAEQALRELKDRTRAAERAAVIARCKELLIALLTPRK